MTFRPRLTLFHVGSIPQEQYLFAVQVTRSWFPFSPWFLRMRLSSSRYYLRFVAFMYYLPAYVFMLFSIDYLLAQVSLFMLGFSDASSFVAFLFFLAAHGILKCISDFRFSSEMMYAGSYCCRRPQTWCVYVCVSICFFVCTPSVARSGHRPVPAGISSFLSLEKWDHFRPV